MFKKYIYKVLGITSVVLMTACNSLLDIKPQTQLPAEAINKATNLEALLISGYGDITSGNFLSGRIQYYSELLADAYKPLFAVDKSDEVGQVILRTTGSVNRQTEDMWVAAYKAIARANDVMRVVDEGKVTDASASTLAQWKAEALFIRAVAHFELVRLYGQPYSNNPNVDPGVPLRIKALQSDEKLGRATVAEVYNQVIADLIAASNALPTTNGNRATKWAAKGYLARVYFNKLDYENAFATAQDVIDNSGIVFTGDPYTAFRNAGNTPAKGGVIFQTVNGPGQLSAFLLVGKAFAFNADQLSFVNANISGDFRIQQMCIEDPAVANNVYSDKWFYGGNFPIIRLAEMHLIRAESAILKGTPDYAAASASYNTVRDFSVTPYTNVTFTAANQVGALADIRKERRLEMMFEGDRYHELRRLKATNYGAINAPPNLNLRPAANYNTQNQLIKLPVSETTGNTNIVQN